METPKKKNEQALDLKPVFDLKQLPMKEIKEAGITDKQLVDPLFRSQLLSGGQTDRISGMKSKLADPEGKTEKSYSAAFQLEKRGDTVGLRTISPKVEESIGQGKKPDVFTAKEVPMEQFSKMGVTKEQLSKPGVMDNLLKGEKTVVVKDISPVGKEGEKLPSYDAAFKLEKKPDGTVGVKVEKIAPAVKQVVDQDLAPRKKEVPEVVKIVASQGISGEKKEEGKEGKKAVGITSENGKISAEAKPEKAEGSKKKKNDEIEVLSSKSWAVNFYHNYMKAVGDVGGAKKLEAKMPIEPKVEKKPEGNFISVMTMPPTGKLDRELLLTAKPDWPVINKMKENFGQEILASKEKSKDMGLSVAPTGVKQKIEGNPASGKEQGPDVRGAQDKFSIKEVPFDRFAKMGVSEEMLIKSGALQKLLDGKVTDPIKNLQITDKEGKEHKFTSVFQLERKPDGSVGIKMQPTEKLSLPNTILGQQMTPQMKEALERNGKVDLKDGNSIVIDKLKNVFQLVKPEPKLPTEVHGVKLTEDQQKSLKEGKEIQLSGMKSKGLTFDGTVKIGEDIKGNKSLNVFNALPSSMAQMTPALKDKDKVAESKGQRIEEKVVKESLRSKDEDSPSKGPKMRM